MSRILRQIRKFCGALPTVRRLPWMQQTVLHLLEWLITGKIDVAVLYNAPRTSNLRAEPLLKEEISLLGPIGDPAGLGSGPVAAARLAEIPPGSRFREGDRTSPVAKLLFCK